MHRAGRWQLRGLKKSQRVSPRGAVSERREGLGTPFGLEFWGGGWRGGGQLVRGRGGGRGEAWVAGATRPGAP